MGHSPDFFIFCFVYSRGQAYANPFLEGTPMDPRTTRVPEKAVMEYKANDQMYERVAQLSTTTPTCQARWLHMTNPNQNDKK
jgi:hypothetical protein